MQFIHKSQLILHILEEFWIELYHQGEELLEMAELPQIAILGAGIFVRTQYIPRLAEISNLFVLKAIWSRSEVEFCFLLSIFNLLVFLEFLFQPNSRIMEKIIRVLSLFCAIVGVNFIESLIPLRAGIRYAREYSKFSGYVTHSNGMK